MQNIFFFYRLLRCIIFAYNININLIDIDDVRINVTDFDDCGLLTRVATIIWTLTEINIIITNANGKK